MSLFGPLLPSLVVERATTATLKLWMNTYLAEVEQQAGMVRGGLLRPRGYPTASLFGRDEDQTPSIGVHCPGIAQSPERKADGVHRVWWTVDIGALVSARDERSTDEITKLYGAAIWGCMMQHPSLGDVADNTRWVGEKYGIAETAKSRTLGFCQLTFEVLLREARGTYGGPAAPDAVDPPGGYGDWPDVDRVVIDLQDLPLDGE